MQPIIIIGAARSGTNMLRDIITKAPNISTWNCDEINPIWKHKNKRYRFDDLSVHQVTTSFKSFINNEFLKIAKRNKTKNVLEKTCANSLRIPFINEALPEAKYIILLRNGYDACISANLRWTAKFNLMYSLKKLRYVPITDIFYYTWQFGKTRLKQFFSKEKKLSVWGPNTSELETFAINKSLLEISAKQWSISVENTITALKKLNPEKYIIISYEKFVSDPVVESLRLFNFLEIQINKSDLLKFTKSVNNKSVGKYKKVLSQVEIKQIEKIIEPTLKLINEFSI